MKPRFHRRNKRINKCNRALAHNIPINIKENNIMSKNLGKSLTETLKEQATNFSKWQSASQAILNGCKSLKKMSNSVEDVNDSLVELGK